MMHLKEPSLQKYLSQLKKQVQVLPVAEQEDLLKELESHFFEELQQGHSPELILQRLGKPETYARQFLNQYTEQLTRSGKLPEHARFLFRRALWPAALLGLGFVALMEANTLYIFADLLRKTPLTGLRSLQILAFSLPAILVVFLPLTPLFLVPLYIYGLRSQNLHRPLRMPKVWLMTLLIGLSAGLLCSGIQELLVPSANRQTIEVIKELMNDEARSKGEPALEFNSEPDVRSQSMFEAYQSLSAHPNAPDRHKSLLDYYTKMSLPLGALACALFGLLTASLMLSGLFQPLYTLLLIGGLLPLSLWYIVYSLAMADTHLPPVWAAFIPDLSLAGLSLLFLIGLFLQLPNLPKESPETG